MSKDALDGWRVYGKITATEQATQAGDVPILDSTGKIPDELINAGGFYHNISFNGTTFASDPTGCLVYSGDLTGASPVRNTSDTLARATQYGSWTPATNPLIAQCCYSTFDEDGD